MSEATVTTSGYVASGTATISLTHTPSMIFVGGDSGTVPLVIFPGEDTTYLYMNPTVSTGTPIAGTFATSFSSSSMEVTITMDSQSVASLTTSSSSDTSAMEDAAKYVMRSGAQFVSLYKL